MKIALIEIYPSKKMNTRKMIDAHLRNSIILSEYLKWHMQDQSLIHRL